MHSVQYHTDRAWDATAATMHSVQYHTDRAWDATAATMHSVQYRTDRAWDATAATIKNMPHIYSLIYVTVCYALWLGHTLWLGGFRFQPTFALVPVVRGD